MKIKIYRKLLEKEKKGIHPLAVIIREQECEDITLHINEINGIPFIDSINIDEEWLLLDDYKDMNFLIVNKN